MSKDLLEAIAAGAAGGLVIIALLRWMFRGHFFDLVLDCFDVREADIKKKLERIFKEPIEERERWYEEIRRNAHSIGGLTETMTKHEMQLQALQSVPMVLQQQLVLLEDLKNDIEENRKEVGRHAIDLAVLIERRNNLR